MPQAVDWDECTIGRVMQLLRDHLSDGVIIGGWVPHAYARWGADPWGGRVAPTTTVDVLTGPSPSGWAARCPPDALITLVTPRTGPASPPGTISPSAVALLAAHTTTLSIPVAEPAGRAGPLEIRLPRLGAYVANQALTVVARSARAMGPTPKQAKDLVYIHDVMAAGDAVRWRVENDMRKIWMSGPSISADHRTMRAAHGNLDLVLRGTLGRALLPAAAAQLGAREGRSVPDAEARIRRALTDLSAMLGEITRRHPRAV